MRHDHERVDGTGYPEGVSGESLHPYARIAAVADVFDAVISARPYRAAMELSQVIDILRTGKGQHFDPAVVDALLEIASPENLDPRMAELYSLRSAA